MNFGWFAGVFERNVFKPKYYARIILSVFMTVVLSGFLSVYGAMCTPESAVVCAAVDDAAELYLNGSDLGPFGYVNFDSSDSAKCISLSGAQLALLQPTGNVLAVKVLNTNCCEIWASWSLDVTCAGGTGHAYVTSGNGTEVKFWKSAPASCPAVDPANDGGGRLWYDPLYTGASGWGTPAVVTGQKWGKRIFDPSNGNLDLALGYDTSSKAASNDCMQLFFRQNFDLTIDPTPVPPHFTIVKSASQTTDIHSPGQLSFTIVICNTGGGTSGNPVEMVDGWTNINWQYSGPFGNIYDTTQGEIDLTQGNPFKWTFINGMNGGSCFTFSALLKSNSYAVCGPTWYNNSQVNYPVGVPQAYSTVTLKNFCPSPTATPSFTLTVTETSTATYTRTSTPTFTVTNSATTTRTDTPSYTATQTITVSASNTFTPTPTFTDTNSATPTRTDTPSYTATPTITVSASDTFTATATPSVTMTHTFTIFTKTATPTFTDTFTDTATKTVTQTATPTVTETKINTVTDTATFTPTYTATYTFTKTKTMTFTNTNTPTYTQTFTFTNTKTFTPSFSTTYTPTGIPLCTNTPTPTVTQTPVPFQFMLSIEVYNEAGEKVKLIMRSPVSGDAVDAALLINGMAASVFNPAADKLELRFTGIQSFDQQGSDPSHTVSYYWDGTTDGGQAVSPGLYYIKISTVDTYGHVTTIVKPVQVIVMDKYVRINIYNSAGELVRRIETHNVTNTNISLKVQDIMQVGKGAGLINIEYAQGASLDWDGLNSQGITVKSGIYEIQAQVKTELGFQTMASKTVTILNMGGSEIITDEKIFPNPIIIAAKGASGFVTVQWLTVSAGQTSVKIYNITGELVKDINMPMSAGMASVRWNLESSGGSMVSSGMYVAVVYVKSYSGETQVKKIKFAVVRSSGAE